MKKALFCSANHYDSTYQVGTHHLARQFAKKGWGVAFLSHPVSPMHALKWKESKQRFHSYLDGLNRIESPGVSAYVPMSLITPYNMPFFRSKSVMLNWQKFAFPNIKRIINEAIGNSIDLIYFDNPTYRFILSEIQYKRSVYRITDKLSEFSWSSNAVTFSESKLINEVDVVGYTSPSLRTYVEEKFAKRCFHVPNGVNIEAYDAVYDLEPLDLKDIPRPRVIYVGAIDSWFDYDLVNRAASQLSNCSFVLIGSDDYIKNKINCEKNIHLLGKKPHTEIPKYLTYSDVGIIPFDVQDKLELVRHVNPLKLYEYLAAGLPVVSTYWEELSKFSQFIKFSNQNNFAQSIASALEEDNFSDRINRKSAAKEYDWSIIAERFINDIFQ